MYTSENVVDTSERRQSTIISIKALPKNKALISFTSRIEIFDYKKKELLHILIDQTHPLFPQCIKITILNNVLVNMNQVFSVLSCDVVSTMLWNLDDYSIKYTKEMFFLNSYISYLRSIEQYREQYVLGLSDEENIIIFDIDNGNWIQIISMRYNYSLDYVKINPKIVHLPYNTMMIISDYTIVYLLDEFDIESNVPSILKKT